MAPLLEATALHAGYGEITVLKDVSISFETGKITAVIGSNGAGKTTFMRAVSGLISIGSGRIRLDGVDVSATRAHERLERGLALVPEGRMVFPDFTVDETLRIGAYVQRARPGWEARAESMYRIFPRLLERKSVLAGALSGGEQQMLALARALMSQPRMLLLDEPSLGLAPMMADEVYEALQRISQEGVTIGLVEQNAFAALSLSDKAYVLENGVVTLAGSSKELLDSPEIRLSYLGM